jgi:hypothetical protein
VTLIRSLEDAQKQIDALSLVFGETSKGIMDSYTMVGNIKSYPVLDTILKMFSESEYECDTSNVIAERIKQKTYAGRGSTWYGGSWGYQTASATYIPKANTRTGLEDEILDFCPFNLSDPERTFFKKLIEGIEYIELRSLCKTAYKMTSEKEVVAEYDEELASDPFAYDEYYSSLYDY